MHIAAAGDRALLVTLKGTGAQRLRAVADRVRAIEGVRAAIIGHESVYVIGTTDSAAIRAAVEDAGEQPDVVPAVHVIDVSFAPEHALDLDALLARAAQSRHAVIARIRDTRLTVRYLGFRAGFAYLDGWPSEWSLPRRPTSRNLVPAGSFAIGGAMAGFYPVDSPGGWNILGRTDMLPPRLMPGDEIRIVPVERPLRFESPPLPHPHGDAIADVVSPGQLTTIVRARDWSRAEIGETPGGPFDELAAAIANEAAGNDAAAPLLECVLVGPRMRFRVARRVAWCGPDGEPRAWSVAAGEEIDIGRIRGAFRGYLAIERGVGGDGLLGKSLVETENIVTPRPAQRGEGGRRPGEGSRLTIRVVRGPHDAPPLPPNWEVTPNLNRVGIRLRPLDDVAVTLPAELPSCGMQFGTLQWHPDGSIVAMGPDHPVTGGYLQPATVISSELWKLGQLAPGERIKLLSE